MLNSAGNTAGDVNLGSYGLASLTDLMRMPNPARINSSTGSADSCSKSFCKISDGLEAFWSASAQIPPAVKFTVGGGLWGMVLLYFALGGLRGRRRA